MEMSFYNGKLGAAAQQAKMDVVANNIANVSTAGYKAKTMRFSDLMYHNMEGIDGTETDAKSGSGVKADRTSTSFEKGSINLSSSQTDFSIEGRGFFALQNPQTGERVYTTCGNFVLAEKGESFYLASKDGNFVIGTDDEPIRIKSGSEEVWDPNMQTDKDGNPLGGMAVSIEEAEPAVFDFPKTEGMLSVGDSNFIPVEKNGEPVLVEDAMVTRGSYEGSNVDISKEFTKVIEAQRAYQYSLRMVQTTDEIQNLVNNLRS